MTMERLIFAVANRVPVRIRTALRGKRSSPNWLANTIHAALNRVPVERYPVLRCGGVLKGFQMRVDWSLHRAFAYGAWEPEVVATLQEQVKPGMTVLDIGAQSGYFSLLFSRLVGVGGKIVAFEPLPANFRMLEENIRLNGLTNVTARREAVAERSGNMSFEFPRHEPTLIAGPVREGEDQDVFTVKGISLDDWFAADSCPVHFIKMDVEGAELEVLRGASRMLASCHPDMLIELHNMEKYSGPHPGVLLLEQLGYEMRWLDEIASTAHIIARWAPNRSREDAGIPAETTSATSGRER